MQAKGWGDWATCALKRAVLHSASVGYAFTIVHSLCGVLQLPNGKLGSAGALIRIHIGSRAIGLAWKAHPASSIAITIAQRSFR